MTTPEGRVKARVTKLLKFHAPHVYFHMPVQNGMGRPTLDYIGSAYGRFFAIETKAPGGKPTARQYNTMKEMREANVTVFVVSDDDTLKAFETWLLSALAKAAND